MQSLKFEGCDVAIAEDQPEYETLHAKRVQVEIIPELPPAQGVVFCWKLSPAEIARIVETGLLWHRVMTFGQPLQPQSLSVESLA